MSSDYSAKESVYLHFKFGVGALGFCEGFFHCVGCCEDHSYTTVAYDFRLAEDADLYARFFKDLFKVTEFVFLSVAFDNDSL